MNIIGRSYMFSADVDQWYHSSATPDSCQGLLFVNFASNAASENSSFIQINIHFHQTFNVLQHVQRCKHVIANWIMMFYGDEITTPTRLLPQWTISYNGETRVFLSLDLVYSILFIELAISNCIAPWRNFQREICVKCGFPKWKMLGFELHLY